MAGEKKHVHINLDAAFELSYLSTRRAYAFLNLGISPIKQLTIDDLHLKDESAIQLFPSEITDKQFSEIKDNYKSWITGNGLRELVEGFGHALNEIYKICFVVSNNNKPLTEEDVTDFNKFNQEGEVKKLKKLKSKYGIDTKIEDQLLSIMRVRNCLTHRGGVVSPQDCDKDASVMSISWMSPFTTMEKQDGTSVEIPMGKIIDIHNPAYSFKKGEQLTFKTHLKEKSANFALGQRIDLDAENLREICMMIQIYTNEIRNSVIQFIQSAGLQVNFPPRDSGVGLIVDEYK